MRENNHLLLSIVTPSYNQVAFIQQTIESVLDQHDPNVQYWVIDGGSTDGTRQILDRYATRLHFVSEKDHGQTDAINKGLRKSLQVAAQPTSPTTSEPGIFAYINSDDYYLPGAFAAVRQAFSKHPEKKWIVGEAMIVNAAGQEIHRPIRWYKRAWRRMLSWFVLCVLNPIPQPAVFIRSDAVTELGPFSTSLKYVMDYDYWLRLYQKFGPPLLLDQPLAAFRIHGQSKGSVSFDQQFSESYLVANQYTKNWLALLGHRLHNQLILWAYRHIK